METIYRDFILDHYQHPFHRGQIDHPTVSEHDTNPLCGDDLTLEIRIAEDGSIEDCGFHGHGCAISQASADLLCEDVIGKNVRELLDMRKEDMLALLGIDLGPVRLKCGLLAFKTLKLGLIKHLQGASKEE
jgi:nitrogen fixation NifU-like protein